MKLSFIFEFQLIPFAFGLILGGPFLVSPPKSIGRGTIFQKKLFMGKKTLGDKYMGVCCTWGGLMIRSCPGRGVVSQNASLSNLNTLSLKNFPNHSGIITYR